ncbi:MAG TPA: hypothetical protein VMF51_10970 [Nocardioides sp.]|uniref:hypothetical protein n=1 Tax=Nocardioides sp. TaxID=35761 RepID=UPI002CC02521|nr:hypothetical protein [Nocardioides sp.]HTW15644.1 hypothetical protein [Nocardioides sp.]
MWRVAECGCVAVVAAVAVLGFTTDSTGLILLAAVLTLPAAGIAVPAYYVAYGVLAQIPGANQSRSSGTATCEPDGTCETSSGDGLASWFAITTDVVGILALTGAAVLNVVLLRKLVAARTSRPPAG